MSSRVPQLRGIRVLAVVMALTAVAIPAPAQATTSTIRDWNAAAITALFNAPSLTAPATSGFGQAPPVGILHLAMAQGAVYDAVNSIDHGHRSYLGVPDTSSGASMDRAAATAAHHVLVGLLPGFPVPGNFTPTEKDQIRQAIRDRLNGLYASYVTGVDPTTDQGILAGAAAASAMLFARGSDGRFGTPGFPIVTNPGPGVWRPVEDSQPPFLNDPNAWVRNVTPFMIDSASQFRTDGMPALTSAEYAAQFNEVKRMGALTGSARTAAQTTLALFYRINPTILFNATFRDVAASHNLSLSEQARLFAMINMAAADSAIACWDDKAYWNFWRPFTAIRLADTDGNPDTSPDAGWRPLIPTGTPPYPDQPSGYNCFTGAVFHTAQDFFGTDKFSFSVTSSGSGTAVTYNYTRFSAVWKDTIDARIWLGIHFRTPDVAGVVIGKKVAHWLDKHFFQPRS
jgi:hypothetical protein